MWIKHSCDFELLSVCRSGSRGKRWKSIAVRGMAIGQEYENGALLNFE